MVLREHHRGWKGDMSKWNASLATWGWTGILKSLITFLFLAGFCLKHFTGNLSVKAGGEDVGHCVI